MPAPYLHIISLNIPYPPDYGGVIDIYFKLKELSDRGVRIILHTFLYNRQPAPELEKICDKVYYYKRKTGLLQNFHSLPYIIYSRRSKELLQRLGEDDYPVLFEGLHSCFYIAHPSLRNKKKFVRMHNIEQEYYFQLAAGTRNPVQKLFFITEALKLKRAEGLLKHADRVLAISEADKLSLEKDFPDVKLIRPFHSNRKITSREGTGDYILYHGNLSVPENIKAVLFLVEEVFSDLPYPVIIAGKKPPARLVDECAGYSNIKIVPDPDEFQMNRLLENAQVIILYTFQGTGIKLKLVDSLYRGRHCIVNSLISRDTGLEEACITADLPAQIKELAEVFMKIPFSQDFKNLRSGVLNKYDNSETGKELFNCLFD